MAEGQVSCAICNIRRPRRYCPGVGGDICPICCGTERENSVSCPLDCPYLRDARSRERAPELDAKDLPHPDIPIDEAFLQRNEPLLILLASGLANAALADQRAIDTDAQEALAALTQTYRTLQTGLYYNAAPQNPIAARIVERVQNRIREVEEIVSKNGGAIRDSDLLGVLVFLQRLERQRNNGRRKGRAFIDFLREFFPPEPLKPEEPPPSLILP